VVGKAIGILGHPHLSQCALHPGVNFLFFQTHVQGPKGHVLKDRGREELVVRILKDHPDPGSDQREVVLREGEVHDLDLSLSLVDAVKLEHEGAFPSSIGPDQSNFLAFSNLKADVFDGAVAVWIGVADVFHSQRDAVAFQFRGKKLVFGMLNGHMESNFYRAFSSGVHQK
jgi:hypothetical protein